MNAAQAHDLIELNYGPVVPLLSKAVRAQFVAGKGKIFYGADFSNIEGRINAWFAGEQWKLDAFRAYDLGTAPDLYRASYARSFGQTVDAVTRPQRKVGKTQELACLAGDVLVLTSRGYKRIREVSGSDLVWDGVSWVGHAGVVAKGVKKVVSVDGTYMTHSHQVFGRSSWHPAGLLASNVDLLRFALERGSQNLPWSERLMNWGVRGEFGFGAPVRPPPTRYFSVISKGVTAPAVLLAVKQNGGRLNAEKTQAWKSAISIDEDSVSGYMLALIGALIPIINNTATTEDGGLEYTNRGLPTNSASWTTFFRLTDGMFQNWNLTALKLMEIMRRETSGLYRDGKMRLINAVLDICSSVLITLSVKQRHFEPVYDIMNAGPRSRFTIKTNSGHLIVHNCGYQGSVGAWLRFDPQPDTVVKVTKEHFYGSDAWKKAAAQFDRERFHHGLTPDQWIAIKVNSNLWRESNSKITASWWEAQDAALMAVESPGTKVTALDGKIAYMVDSGILWCQLPSGKLLAYAQPRLVTMKEEWIVGADGDSISVTELEEAEVAARLAAGAKIEAGRPRTQVAFQGKRKNGSWGTCYLYGGLQCNNYTQATARELLRFAMLNIERAGYPLVMHVHDETVSEVDAGFGSVEEYQSLMSILPPWLDGLPLAAKAWTDTRYVK